MSKSTNINPPSESRQVLHIEDVKLQTEDRSTGKGKILAGALVVILLVSVIVGVIIWQVKRPKGDANPVVENPDKPHGGSDIPEAELQRIDCYPETAGGVETVNQEKCESRGCIWQETENERVPWCYVPQLGDGQGFGYSIVGGPEDTPLGQRWYLKRVNQFAIYDENIEFLTFDVEYRDNHLLRFKFDDANDTTRFKVPVPLTLGQVKAEDPEYEIQVQQNETFSFKVFRKATGTVLWDTSVGGFAFANQFLQISARLPSENIYGIGENLHYSFKHNLNYQTWPLWSRDQPPGSGDDTYNQNLYSVHPFYECLENDGNTHGVLLLNANAMDYTFTPLPMLTYKTIGGILDFYMFLGPSPENVVQQYTEAVGRPYMPPYFMLGFQLSRFNYENTADVRDTVQRNLDANIPLDVQYVDIDYMYKKRDFTLDEQAFGDLPEYFVYLRELGMKTVIILDPTLEINETYRYYTEGREQDIYVKWPDVESMPEGDYEEYNRTDMMGYVWPEWKCVFPDFFLNETADLWVDWLVDFRINTLEFDALWIDMNEPANFDTNGWRPWNWPEDDPTNWTLKCPNNTWDDPPYRTKAAYLYDDPSQGRLERLSMKTICLIGEHDRGQSKHYDLHSLYGYKQTIHSLRGMREAVKMAEGIDKRSMVVTRSTYSGSGQHAGRWLGDNTSAWKDLALSIIGMLEFNIMGFPYVGADICGYFLDTTVELCKRWQEVGAFYPYSRNHNHEFPLPQDPAYMGPEVVEATRASLLIRYSLLPYFYTLFYVAHTRGNTVIRPVFHEFPTDTNTWAIERQFLWGPALLISPILEEGQSELSYYVPRGRWYDWYTNGVAHETEGEWITIPVTIDTPIQLHIRGGYILPWQYPANCTHYSRRNGFGLKVALDAVDGEAQGELFWDDGDSIDTFENGNYYLASYKASSGTLDMNLEHNNIPDEMSELVMTTVQVYGVSDANYIYVNDVQHFNFIFDEGLQYVQIQDLQLPLNSEVFKIEWRRSPKPSSKKGTGGSRLQEAERLDCCPAGCDQVGCEAMSCIWTESPTPGVPWCYIDNAVYGYGDLTRPRPEYEAIWKGQSSLFGGDIVNIKITPEEYDYVYRIKVEDKDDPDRYQVPLNLNLTDGDVAGLFDFQVTGEPYVSMTLKRNGASNNLIDTSIGGFTMADQYLQFSTRLATTNVYGFGENVHPSLRHNFEDFNTWAMFARDQPPGEAGANLYSTHPFYLVVEEDGKSHGVLFWNSNAMEVVFLPAPGLTIRSIGGIMDIYVIIGDNPEQVIQRYHQLIGKPFLPPYWSLGFHLSRYGYNSLDNLRMVVDRNIEANIPLDVIYMDIDSFEENKIFTWDRDRFAGLPEYLNEVHDMQMKVVLILDPFLISNETNYPPYDLGLERDVFIKWPEGESPDYEINGNDILLGYAWPKGRVVFPDFFHSNSTGYWEFLIEDYHKELSFDGIWLDMNEPANFGTNEDKPWNWPDDALPYWSLKCPDDNSWDAPPYKPGSMLGPWVCDKTICMTALQRDDGSLRHYNVHNLYGHKQTVPTESALRKTFPGQRSFIITRSTFPGTGAYAGRWLGDNASIWPHLKDSIIGMLEFNLFGVPYVGADICGYFDNCPEELCQRWQQLGAFYPFSRNHNGLGHADQDPAVFSLGMQSSTRKVLEVRYQLLPYLYTLFYHVHTHGGTVARPLFHEFPTDSRALAVEEQFLWGAALLISPVLNQGVTTVNAYFPKARWFDYYSGEEIPETGRSQDLDAPLDHIPVHVRGGYILPMQQPANNTYYSRQTGFQLLVAPDENSTASGDLFWDDGQSADTIQDDRYSLLQFSFEENAVSMTFWSKTEDVAGLFMDVIRVLGVNSEPQEVTSDPPSDTLTVVYNPDTKVLLIENLQLSMTEPFTVSWTF